MRCLPALATLLTLWSCGGGSSQGIPTGDCVREINGDSCSCNAVNPRYQGGTDHCGPSDVAGTPASCCTIVASAHYCACNAYVCSKNGGGDCACVWIGAPLYETVVPTCGSASGTYCCVGSVEGATGGPPDAGFDEPFGIGCFCGSTPCNAFSRQVTDCGGDNIPPACPSPDAIVVCQ